VFDIGMANLRQSSPLPRVGVVLLHGFGGAREGVQPWGDHLAAMGYDVEVPLLPGHGTTWQDHATTTWRDWYGGVVETFDRLHARTDFVFVSGLSLGGSLTLQLAADRPGDVAGAMVVNPAVEMHKRGDWVTPVLKHLISSVPADYDDIKRPGVSENSYQRISVKAGHSAMKAMKPLRASLPRITSPLIYFRSVNDHVVSDKSHELVMSRVSSTDKTLHLLADSYHVATLDNDAPLIHEASAAFISRVTAARIAVH
jgi:carboxylesterase